MKAFEDFRRLVDTCCPMWRLVGFETSRAAFGGTLLTGIASAQSSTRVRHGLRS